MEQGHLNPEGTKAPYESWIDRIDACLYPAGDAILRFAETRSLLQCLMALGGLLAVAGTMFPWTYAGGLLFREETYVGFTTFEGKILAVSGLAIIFFSLFARTKPGKRSSLLASGVALVDLLLGCALLYLGTALTDAATPVGSGYALSWAGISLTFMFGLIPNAKQ